MIPPNTSECGSGSDSGSGSGFGSGLGRGARVSLTTAYCVLCACGSLLNLLVIYLVVSFKKLRTASNAFIVNGCAADLLVCAVWMPHEAAAVSGAGGGGGGGSGSAPAPAPYRLFREALLLLGITVSLLSHALIAVNRFVLITKPPAAYHALYTKRHTEVMMAGSWLLALATAAAAGCDGDGDGDGGGGGWSGGSVPSGPVPAAALALTILLQTGVLLCCYFRIFRRVQSSVKRVSVLHFQLVQPLPCALPPPPPPLPLLPLRRDRRLGLHVLAVCCVSLLATQPVLWTLAAGLLVPVPPAPRAAAWVLFCTVFVSDPFLYTWKNEEFRRSLRAVLRGEPWRGGSAVGVEPITGSTVSGLPHLLARQNSRRAFLQDAS